MRLRRTALRYSQLLGSFALLFGVGNAFAAFDLYVATTGNDSNAGTLDSPFATVQKARDTIRSLKSGAGLPDGGVNVWIRQGTYSFSNTLTLASQDSGESAKPILYSAYPGELVHIQGGATLSPGDFSLITSSSPAWGRLDPAARTHVYSINLKSQGITDYGTLRQRGFNATLVGAMELFYDGRPQTLARWPNLHEPWARTVAGLSNTQFTYTGSRPDGWTNATDIWMHGFWGFSWADFHVPVSSINTATKTITFREGPSAFGVTSDRPYYAYNILEELDQPGEYYIDRTAGILYFWPPKDSLSAPIHVSLLETPLFQFNTTSYVTLRNLILEASRTTLVSIQGGAHNRVDGCLLRNSGQSAIDISGSDNAITASEIADCGESGAIVAGGDRANLTDAGNYVENCSIHRTGRIAFCYHPAVNLNGGCGNRASHNLIEDLPHAGILYGGNNHTIEYSEIRRVCSYTSDAGAIYAGRHWDWRGNVLRYNFIHHIASGQKGWGAHGIYLDDCLSGQQLIGNIVYQVSDIGLLVGGGRDTIMRNNVIARCRTGHFCDQRGFTDINNKPGDSTNLLERMYDNGVQYQQPPWSTAYPAAAAIPNSWTEIQKGNWRGPEHNIFDSNVGWDNQLWLYQSNPTGVFDLYTSMANNVASQSPLFTANAAHDRFQRAATITAATPSFQPIPFANIGPMATAITPIAAPPAPLLSGKVISDTRINLAWDDNSYFGLWRESGFIIDRRILPGGNWISFFSTSPSCTQFELYGLAPNHSYEFRVRAFNDEGASSSNVVGLQTEKSPPLPGVATRIEAESSFQVISDLHQNGHVGVGNANLDSSQCVRMFDTGDVIGISFTVPVTSIYRIGVRLRSGGLGNPTDFWPAGYQFRVDGTTTVLMGVPSTVSAFDTSFGGMYWGRMDSGTLNLTAGSHTIEIITSSDWALIDYAEIVPLSPAPINTFALWQAAHFPADLIPEAATAGSLASPLNDGYSNLLKYALGLDPWARSPVAALTVNLIGTSLRGTYKRPPDLADITYIVESSPNLIAWTALSQTSLGIADGFESFEVNDPATTTPRFMRLRMTKIAP